MVLEDHGGTIEHWGGGMSMTNQNEVKLIDCYRRLCCPLVGRVGFMAKLGTGCWWTNSDKPVGSYKLISNTMATNEREL